MSAPLTDAEIEEVRALIVERREERLNPPTLDEMVAFATARWERISPQSPQGLSASGGEHDA